MSVGVGNQWLALPIIVVVVAVAVAAVVVFVVAVAAARFSVDVMEVRRRLSAARWRVRPPWSAAKIK